MAAEAPPEPPNPDWVAPEFKAKATASSFYGDPPGGYAAENVGGDNLFTGWEADQQAAGAWLQIDFPEPRQVSELFILAQPLPRDIIGQDVYSMTYSRVALLEAAAETHLLVLGSHQHTYRIGAAWIFRNHHPPQAGQDLVRPPHH